MNPKAQAALQLGQALVDCLSSGRFEDILPLLHEDIVLEVVFPFAKGEDTVGARYQRGEAVHRYLRVAQERSAEIAFRGAVWRTTDDGWAIFQADAANVLADGSLHPQSYLFMFEPRDGKIVWWLEYLNPVCAVLALGAPLDSLPYAR